MAEEARRGDGFETGPSQGFVVKELGGLLDQVEEGAPDALRSFQAFALLAALSAGALEVPHQPYLLFGKPQLLLNDTFSSS